LLKGSLNDIKVKAKDIKVKAPLNVTRANTCLAREQKSFRAADTSVPG
jgi:hypothetical protein